MIVDFYTWKNTKIHTSNSILYNPVCDNMVYIVDELAIKLGYRNHQFAAYGYNKGYYFWNYDDIPFDKILCLRHVKYSTVDYRYFVLAVWSDLV